VFLNENSINFLHRGRSREIIDGEDPDMMMDDIFNSKD